MALLMKMVQIIVKMMGILLEFDPPGIALIGSFGMILCHSKMWLFFHIWRCAAMELLLCLHQNFR
jgi:hypothetical protein